MKSTNAKDNTALIQVRVEMSLGSPLRHSTIVLPFLGDVSKRALMYLACAWSTLKRSPIAILRASCLSRSSDRAGCDSTEASPRLNAESQRSQISQSSRTRTKRLSSIGETKNVSPYSSEL